MDIDFEGRVWKKAAQVFGPRLQNLVDEGIASFKRRPGLDDPTRVHAALIGTLGFEALQGALEARGIVEQAWGGIGFIVVRSHLRTHLRRHLQWQLMQTADWSDEIGDSYFAGDLGL
ncbi:hypothetical protein [Pseudomonas amygdali]|uniref:hypothetical protein n=1 Tax=Pseudomonas amygdali TaxID=47877 RepID=UPI001C59F36E|nr:hypothetical protein [Pseudomonas amygdali]QXW42705.1 hypothetical protein KXJ79_13160 [Pseudomonas amygdali]